MTFDEVIDILENEKKCVIRARECDRKCSRCDLLRTEEEITEALECGILSIRLAQQTMKGMGMGVISR